MAPKEVSLQAIFWASRSTLIVGPSIVAPSNYLKEITPKSAEVETTASGTTFTQATETAVSETYPYKAEALFACKRIPPS
jgi:hypothetical protein